MHITGTESVHMMRKLQAATTSAAFSRSWRLVKRNFILKRKGNGIATPTTLNTYTPRDAENAAPVAPKRTERVDDFADLSFGKIEL